MTYVNAAPDDAPDPGTVLPDALLPDEAGCADETEPADSRSTVVRADVEAVRGQPAGAGPGAVAADHVPDWFWQALDAARPRLAALEHWLGTQPRQVVEDFALAHETAQDALADPAEGVRVDGETWSEDSTEDLCRWVVGQGRELWTAVVTGKSTLEAAARQYLDDAKPWNEEVADPRHRGYQSPGHLAHGVYRTRFGEDLDDRLDHRR